jgi:hypothetical protein
MAAFGCSFFLVLEVRSFTSKSWFHFTQLIDIVFLFVQMQVFSAEYRCEYGRFPMSARFDNH